MENTELAKFTDAIAAANEEYSKAMAMVRPLRKSMPTWARLALEASIEEHFYQHIGRLTPAEFWSLESLEHDATPDELCEMGRTIYREYLSGNASGLWQQFADSDI